jgi:hypothetical protein
VAAASSNENSRNSERSCRPQPVSPHNQSPDADDIATGKDLAMGISLNTQQKHALEELSNNLMCRRVNNYLTSKGEVRMESVYFQGLPLAVCTCGFCGTEKQTISGW